MEHIARDPRRGLILTIPWDQVCVAHFAIALPLLVSLVGSLAAWGLGQRGHDAL
jgi:hypothetical protein